MTVLTWILAAIISFFFVMVGIVKIFGTPKKMFKEQKKKFFDKYGIDRSGIRSIGIAEVLGGVAILFWSVNLRVALSGGIALIFITAGATYFHFVYDKKPEPQAAITMLVLTIGFILTLIF